MKKLIILLFLISIILIGSFVYFDLHQNKINFHEVVIKITKNDNNYMEVNNTDDFIHALNNNIKNINITKDLDLGYKVIGESKYIKKHNDALTHPILKKTGVSKLLLKNIDGLMIQSSNGSKLLHTNIVIENSKNIEISNIELDELWEWDEETFAGYDKDDWDAISIKNSKNILIDHLTFHKVYDGIIDISDSKNITIRNTKVEKTDIDNNSFFNSQFEELETNIDNYPMYQFLREEVGLTIKQVKQLSSYQYKGILIGTKDYGEKNENIVIHDNLFLDIKLRIPQARNSSVYVYNNYIDSSSITYDIMSKKQKILINSTYPKLVKLATYGIISLQKSYIISENNIFIGVDFPYTRGRDNKYRNYGLIMIKDNKNQNQDLKEKLYKNAGVKKNISSD